MSAVPPNFFASPDVVLLARKLLGMELWVDGAHGVRRGMITETEAYAGMGDRGSHAFGGKMTKRNAVMFGEAGHVYMYLCYGVHWMLNVVTAPEGIPHAILIRAIKPISPKREPAEIARGPGKLTRWLGVDGSFNGESLASGRIGLDHAPMVGGTIMQSARIGIAYAGSDASLPYRFFIQNEPSVSRPLQPRYPKN